MRRFSNASLFKFVVLLCYKKSVEVNAQSTSALQPECSSKKQHSFILLSLLLLLPQKSRL
jgi:hypothetical protein